MSEMQIRPYSPRDENQVVGLWARCGLTRPWNDQHKDIQRKMKVNPELFLVGIVDGTIVSAAMGGYEGHRGWVNYLAVDPAFRRQGLGSQLMLFIEKELLLMGCPKINLQVRAGNLEAIEFYRSMGYKLDEVVSMGKRLIEDDINRGYVKGSADFDPDALRARAQGCCSRKLISQNGNGSNIWHMTRRGIQSMLNDYRQKIGLPYNAHTLKRTFASNLHRKGVDVEHIMRLGGWGKLEIVVTYTKNMKFEDSLAVYNNGMQKSGFFRGPGLFCIHVTNSI